MKIKNLFFFFTVLMLYASASFAQTTVTLTSSTGEITLTDGQILTGTGGTETHVTIADGATVTLSGVTITSIPNDNNNYRWAGITCAGDATIILADATTNNLTGGKHSPGIFIPENKTLSIKGNGTLNAKSGDIGSNIQNGSSGIGGGTISPKCGNIIIYSGTITAEGYKSAGIGAAYGSSSATSKTSCGNITILGGTITAIGGYGSAGIGAGCYFSTCGNILISGGTITATGGQAGAGIGTGLGYNQGTISSICGNITITSGTFKVTKGQNATNSIGVGKYGKCGTVTIASVVGAISTSPYNKTIEASTYSVQFNANGGSGSMSSQTINVGVATPLTRNCFTRDGYAFIGWSNTVDGDVAYTNGQDVTDLVAANGTKTLYAKWMSTADFPVGIQVDADYLENQTGFYYINMPINNVSTTINVSDFKYFPFKIYDDGGKNNNASNHQRGYLTICSPTGYKVTLTGNVLSYKSQYQVCLKVYDGSNTNANKLGEYYYTNNISISSTESNITLDFYGNGEYFEGLNLTATTSPIDYSITYNGIEGATLSTPNPESYTIETESFSLINPTRDGYTFLGWTYEGQDKPTKTVTITNGSTGNKKFTANWKQELGALTLYYSGENVTAEINGNYTKDETPVTIASDIEVNSITIDRTFQIGVTSTIILPFGVESGNYSGGTFYEFTSVDYEDGKWVASMTKVTGKIEAHKPYLFVPSSDKLTITGGVKLEATSAEEYEDVKGDWTFKGVFKVKKWKTSVRTDYFFASTSGTSTAGDAISAGDFVRVGNNCGLNPLRCYLSYSGSDAALSKAEKQLPSSIEVRLIDEVASVVEPNDNPSDNDGDIETPVSEIIPNSGVKVWSYDRTIFIESQSGSDYTVVDLSGRTLKKGVTNSTREEVTLGSRIAGIVIVKVGKQTFKINY